MSSDINAQLSEVELFKKAKEVNAKRINKEHQKLLEEEGRYLDVSAPIDFAPPEVRAQQIMNEMEEQSNNPLIGMEFICPSLGKLVQFRPKQMIVIAGHSGKGKTSIVANLCSSLKRQQKRILVFSTEEDAVSMYSRIVRCETGINMPDMTDGVIPKDPQKWAQGKAHTAELTKWIEIIDIGTKGDARYVQTIDGFKHAWKSARPETFDVVIIDYYQKIAENTRNPGLKDHEVHQDLCRFLDTEKTSRLKNVPIIVMAQVRANKDGENLSAEERLWGRKEIFRVCTYFIEIIPNKRKYKGEWMIWKSRSNSTEKWSKIAGFDKVFCTYVDNNEDFQRKRDQWIIEDDNHRLPTLEEMK